MKKDELIVANKKEISIKNMGYILKQEMCIRDSISLCIIRKGAAPAAATRLHSKASDGQAFSIPRMFISI